MAKSQPTSAPLMYQYAKEYKCWEALRQRCLNPNSQAYASYGGRGITVHPSWLASFPQFLADMGPAPSSAHSIDRVNNDGGYAPDNCRWATKSEQVRNRRAPRIHKPAAPKQTGRTPRYCFHKNSGRGYARFGSPTPVYFPGPYGSPESVAVYQLALDTWLRHRSRGKPCPQSRLCPAINGKNYVQLIRAFAKYYDEQHAKHAQ